MASSASRVWMAPREGACPDAVLIVREARDTSEYGQTVFDGDAATDELLVFRDTDTGWALLGRASFNAALDNGTIDYDPGVAALEVKSQGGWRWLVVTVEQAQGGVDPRWFRRRAHWLRIGDDGVAEEFACDVNESQISGPCRSARTFRRTLQVGLDSNGQPFVDVLESGSRDIDDEEECAVDTESLPDRRGRYGWASRGFLPLGVDLCRWSP